MLSVRSRLTLIILLPLLVVSAGIGYWAYKNSRANAASRFDKSLYSTAVSISQDIARADGDALSLRTRDMLNDTSGGRVFYHVYAPDGVFVTGYATPPVATNQLDTEPLIYFDALYHGEQVRVIRLRDIMQIDGLHGAFNFTVWQNTAVRDAFVRDLTQQTYTVIAALAASVGLIVWIGVRVGLRPLLDLQNAISIRSTDDLTPIRRAVPEEVKGIVKTLNSLLQQVDGSMQTKNEFISNAAHQLRNPVAGVLAMADAVKSAPSAEEALSRTDDLYEAAQQANQLANKLLSFERANRAANDYHEQVNIVDIARAACTKQLAQKLTAVNIEFETTESTITINADQLMIGEAIANLIDNALLHGGQNLTTVNVSVQRNADQVRVCVNDNGDGLSPDQQRKALERFGQINTGSGSGLGLSIVQTVAKNHGGRFEFESTQTGLNAVLVLPTID